MRAKPTQQKLAHVPNVDLPIPSSAIGWMHGGLSQFFLAVP